MDESKDSANFRKTSIKVTADGKQLEFSSKEEFEKWLVSRPGGDKVLEEMKKNAPGSGFVKSSKKLIQFTDRKGEVHSFDSDAEFIAWVSEHPEYKDAAKNLALAESSFGSAPQNPATAQVVDQVKERLNISGELPDTLIREICSLARCSPEDVLGKLKADPSLNVERRGPLAFLGIGEIWFSKKKNQ